MYLGDICEPEVAVALSLDCMHDWEAEITGHTRKRYPRTSKGLFFESFSRECHNEKIRTPCYTPNASSEADDGAGDDGPMGCDSYERLLMNCIPDCSRGDVY